MSIVTIKEVKGVVKCNEDGAAEHVFNVKNATDKMLKIGMHLFASEPVKEEWLQIDGPTEYALNVEQMTQVSVKIQVPPDCKPGKYSYHLRVFDPDQPGNVYAKGDSVYFEVPLKKDDDIKVNIVTPKKKWWIPVAITVGVIIIGLVVWQILPKKFEMPDFTQEEWTQEKAEKFLEDNKITYFLELQSDPDPMSGRQILGQTPPAGSKIKKEENVTLKIAGTQVPPLQNLSLSAALQNISLKGLSFNTDNDLQFQGVSNADQHDKILRQDPQQGKLVAKKSSVKLTVGRFSDRRFELENLSKLKTLKGIKLSPMFMTREVQPASE